MIKWKKWKASRRPTREAGSDDHSGMDDRMLSVILLLFEMLFSNAVKLMATSRKVLVITTKVTMLWHITELIVVYFRTI